MTPVNEFQLPDRPRRQARVPERQVVRQCGCSSTRKPGLALGRHGIVVGHRDRRQRRPVVEADGVRFDDDVVVVRLDVENCS